MLPKANGFQNLNQPAQGSAIDQAGSIGSGANVIYPEAFAGRGYANVETTSLYASAEAIGIGQATSIGSASQDGIMSDPAREEIKAEISASEAHADTKIARMEGKLDLLVSKIDGMNSRFDDVRHDYRATRANIWVVGLGLAVLIVAVAALFPVFFGVGTQMRDIIDKAIEAHMSSTTTAAPSRPANTP